LKSVHHRFQTGFTLVETLISVAITGIISSLVVTSIFTPNQTSASEQSIQSNYSSRIETGGSLSQSNINLNTVTQDNSTPDLTEVQKQAEVSSRKMELRIVQTAVDLMMISGGLHIIQETPVTSDMSVFPAGNPVYPRFVRESATEYYYSCNLSGEVTQSGK
jgi:prepilin-type N-terminal cleavage/methylation domain-containing protein